MKRVWAIARHTLSEGLRMRVVLVLVIVLILVLLRLPFALKGDETLSGRLQTFIAYGLGALSFLLGLATIFLSCATLTKEVQTRTLHLIVTKPVSRFEVLAGKWIGVNLLNVILLVIGGLTIYGFASFIKNRPETNQRDRLKLEDTIWTARVAARPSRPDFRRIAEEQISERVEQGYDYPMGQEMAIQQRMRELTEEWRAVPPGGRRDYLFEGLPPPDEAATVYQVRFKIRGIPPPPSEMLEIGWAIMDPRTGEVLQTLVSEERSDEVHEFLVRDTAVRDQKAALGVANLNERSVAYFEGDGGLEILYRVAGFESNYVKALAMILLRLAFLSAVALFFGTFVSFPVACFCVLSMYAFCLAVPWWMQSIGAHLTTPDPSVDPYGTWGPAVRAVLVPALRLLLPDFVHYDGVSKLIDGTYIDLNLVLQTAAHTLVYGLLLLAVPGWLIFRSREIAHTIV